MSAYDPDSSFSCIDHDKVTLCYILYLVIREQISKSRSIKPLSHCLVLALVCKPHILSWGPNEPFPFDSCQFPAQTYFILALLLTYAIPLSKLLLISVQSFMFHIFTCTTINSKSFIVEWHFEDQLTFLFLFGNEL